MYYLSISVVFNRNLVIRDVYCLNDAKVYRIKDQDPQLIAE